MPTVAERPLAPARLHGLALLPSAEETAPQGPEGLELARQLDQRERRLAEVATAQLTPDEALEEIDYRPAPPRRTFQMDVYVHLLGRGRPMPYVLDDDDLGQ
jgi:hypothetical protein